EWGYVARGPLDAVSSVFCTPSQCPSELPSASRLTAGTRYSTLQAAAQHLRRASAAGEPRALIRSDLDLDRPEPLGGAVADLAQQLERVRTIIEQQATRMQRMEAHIVTMRR